MLQPVLAMVLVSQMLTEWAKVLQQSLPTVPSGSGVHGSGGPLSPGPEICAASILLRFGSSASVGAWAQMLVC